jgi:hypothetical protein
VVVSSAPRYSTGLPYDPYALWGSKHAWRGSRSKPTRIYVVLDWIQPATARQRASAAIIPPQMDDREGVANMAPK